MLDSRPRRKPLDADDTRRARASAPDCSRGHVLTATTLAASGHPGGSFSSMEIYTLLYSHRAPATRRAAVGRARPHRRLATATRRPGVYAALAAAGFFPAEEFVAHFRQAGSVFEGHVERSVPGVEWSTGNLGQGLSAGVGFALGARLTGAELAHVRGDERRRAAQGAGRRGAPARRQGAARQPDRGRRLERHPDLRPHRRGHAGAHRRGLGGRRLARLRVRRPRPGRAARGARGRGRRRRAERRARPHGHRQGRLVHGGPARVPRPRADRRGVRARRWPSSGWIPARSTRPRARARRAVRGRRARRTRRLRVCGRAGRAADRTRADEQDRQPLGVGHGAGRPRRGQPASSPIAVLDCDLAVSVKTDGFAAARPERFIQCGVGEHNAATVGGALSTVPGVLAFWARLRRVRHRRGLQPAAAQRHQRRGAEARRDPLRARRGGGRQDAPVPRLRGRAARLLRLEGDRARRPEPDRPCRARCGRDAGQRRDRDGPQQAAGVCSTRTASRSSATTTSSPTARSSGRARAATRAC